MNGEDAMRKTARRSFVGSMFALLESERSTSYSTEHNPKVTSGVLLILTTRSLGDFTVDENEESTPIGVPQSI